MSNKKRGRKKSTLLKYMRITLRILARARDLYIQSLTGGGPHVSYGNTMGCPTPQIHRLPKSYKTSEEQLKEMTRFASNRRVTGKIEPEILTAPVKQSETAAFERIDEEEVFIDGADDVVLLRGSKISSSFAIAKRSNKRHVSAREDIETVN